MFESLVWLDPEKFPAQAGFDPGIFRSRGGRLTTRPSRRYDTKGRLFVFDISMNWPSNLYWQTKVLDEWKSAQLNLLRPKSVNTDSTPLTTPWDNQTDCTPLTTPWDTHTARHLPQLETPRQTARHLPRLETPRQTARHLPHLETPRQTARHLPHLETPRQTARHLPQLETPRQTARHLPHLEALKQSWFSQYNNSSGSFLQISTCVRWTSF